MIQDLRIDQSEIFEKVVLRNGKLFRVRFVVIEREGKLRGKVVSCDVIETLDGDINDTKKYFPLDIELGGFFEETRTFDVIASPYSYLDFFVSQMTRAPSWLLMHDA